MVALEGLRVGVYTRISDDTGADAQGVGRQEQTCRRFVTAHGGKVDRTYTENDTSAYRKRRVKQPDGTSVYRVLRPVYQQMLADLRAGDLDAACVYDLDRLARDNRDLEDAIEIVEHHKRPIVGTTGGIDLLTDNGRAMARVLVSMANKSSADTARRVRDKHRDNAERGIPVGGTRPFGWQDDKRTLHRSEAALIRRAAKEVLAGRPLSAIVTEWNAKGLRTPRGNEWRPKALGLVLTNPRVCGYSARNLDDGNGKPVLTVIRTADGSPVIGVWTPILTPDAWEALCARLAPKRPRPGSNAHKYLLSGIARCGKCDAPLRGLPRRHVKRDTYQYVCPTTSLGGCGGVARNGERVDALVIEAVLRHLDRRRQSVAKQTAVARWPGEADLERVTRKIAEQTQAWHDDLISTAKHYTDLPLLEAEQRQLRAERAEHLAAQAARAHAPADMRSGWPNYTLAEKRAAISRVLATVIIRPVTDRSRPFDPSLVEPIFRES